MTGLLQIDAKQRTKLEGAARLLSSDNAGEVAAAVKAIDRMLPGDLSLTDFFVERLTDSPTDDRTWPELASLCLAHSNKLDAREYSFAVGMALRNTAPSAKQMAWLRGLVRRVEGGAK